MKLLLRLFLFISLLFIGGCKEELFKDLNQNEVVNMIYILDQNEISSHKTFDKKSKFSLHVDKSNLTEAIIALKEQGYPKDSARACVKSDSLVVSPLEERALHICRLSQDLQETIIKIDGVLTARVHIVSPENDPFRGINTPSSAAVFIKHHPNVSLKNIKTSIKLIVEKSIEGLRYDKVSVVMLPATKIKMGKKKTKAVNSISMNWLYFLFIPVFLLLANLLWHNIANKKEKKLQEFLEKDAA